MSSAPDDARQGPLKIKNSKDRPKAKPIEYGICCMYKGGVKDDLTGQELPDDLVKVGMTKELDYF